MHRRGQEKVKPGWNDNVQFLKSEALSWHKLWKCNGCPRDAIELLDI